MALYAKALMARRPDIRLVLVCILQVKVMILQDRAGEIKRQVD